MQTRTRGNQSDTCSGDTSGVSQLTFILHLIEVGQLGGSVDGAG
jgi:hypothetical protein